MDRDTMKMKFAEYKTYWIVAVIMQFGGTGLAIARGMDPAFAVAVGLVGLLMYMAWVYLLTLLMYLAVKGITKIFNQPMYGTFRRKWTSPVSMDTGLSNFHHRLELGR
jgi:hypothetical protein